MLNVTHQGATRDVASVHFRPSITRMDILVNILLSDTLTASATSGGGSVFTAIFPFVCLLVC